MIIVKNLWFKYNRLYVLKNINLKIGEGELICILGDNGAGKTTLIKHFNGLLKPSKGLVKVDGLDTKNTPVSKLSKKVAIVFQYPETMFFTSNLIEEVSFALKNFGFKDEAINRQVEKVLKMFWLWRYRDRSPYILSGGEQRRLALAIVLAWNPRYIIMDEPTAGQDAFQREVLLGVIRELVRRGKTIVLVTHDIEFIFEIKSRIILLKDGEVIYDGDSSTLFNKKTYLLEEAGLDAPTLIKASKLLSQHGIPIEFTDYSDALEKIYRLLTGS